MPTSSSGSLAPRAARQRLAAAAAPMRRQQRGRLAVAATAAADTAAADTQAGGFKPEKPTLFGVPVSNCAARVRCLLCRRRGGWRSMLRYNAPRPACGGGYVASRGGVNNALLTPGQRCSRAAVP